MKKTILLLVLFAVSGFTLNNAFQAILPEANLLGHVINVDSTQSLSQYSVTVPVSDDGYVITDEPDDNFAGDDELEIDGRPQKMAYLKFNLAGMDLSTLSSATLVLHIENSGYLSTIYEVEDDWDQQSLTYNTRPSRTGAILYDQTKRYSKNDWVQIPLEGIQEGVFSIELFSDVFDGLDFDSIDNEDDHPYLVLTFSDSLECVPGPYGDVNKDGVVDNTDYCELVQILNKEVDCAECNIPGCTGMTACTDNDGDGYSVEGGNCGTVDCNDQDPDVHPGASEVCGNGIDEDCSESDLVCTSEGDLKVPSQYPTIQSAIDAAQEGDTILVSAGTYNEAITINKRVHLLAETYDAANLRSNTVIIDGNGAEAVVTIPEGISPDLTSSVPYPTITGFWIRDASDDGIMPNSPFIVEYSYFTEAGDLIDYEEGSGGITRYNIFERASDDALDLDHQVRDLTIMGNKILDSNQDGIEIRLQDDSISGQATIRIVDNTIARSGEDGIQFIDYYELTDRLHIIERNLFIDNGMAAIGMMDNEDTNEDYRAAGILEPIHVFNNVFDGNDRAISGGDNVVALNNIFMNTPDPVLNDVGGNSIVAYSLLSGTAPGSNIDQGTTYSGDPMLGADYVPMAGSPAIDAGIRRYSHDSALVLDILDSQIEGTAPDIGAFETGLSATCTDNDNDGYAQEGGQCGTIDCNDNNAAIYPSASEICGNNIDEDCSGSDLACQSSDLLAPPANFKVAFIGDTGYGEDARAVLRVIKNNGVDAVVHMGDMAYNDENADDAINWHDMVTDELGASFPYFGTVGNHDDTAWDTYQQLLENRASLAGATCTGDYGTNAVCTYQGMYFILSDGGIFKSDTENQAYIENHLTDNPYLWRICAWHYNQEEMQVGGKGDQAGWEIYEACREGGAMIATAHEHSYGRTKTLTDMDSLQIDTAQHPVVNGVPSNPDNVVVDEGRTFAFYNGLGGRSKRDQERCFPSTYPYSGEAGCNYIWASLYTYDTSDDNQNAEYGALICTFNENGIAQKAHCQFIDITGKVVDDFSITNMVDATAPRCTDNDGDGYNVEGGSCGTIDCNDRDPDVYPGASEVCGNGIDEDCSGNDLTCQTTCTDNDGDGYSAEGGSCGTIDCNDRDPDVYPGASEVCGNGIDEDCSGNDLACTGLQMKLVPTFESMSIYADAPGCSGTLDVQYRVQGSSLWKEGHPVQCKEDQYRGSLVRLEPDTTYEVRLGSSVQTASTWPDQFPVQQVSRLPSMTTSCNNNANLVITASMSGTAEGYHVFEPFGTSAILDGQNRCDYNIFVEDGAHHIIIRGLELVNAAQDAIMLSDGDDEDPNDGAHHIVIQNNDIHHWGASGIDAGEDHGAIASEFTCERCLGGVKNIVIENNNIHEPNGAARDWDYGHPQGPRAVHLVSPQGQIVIRNNNMWSDDDHRYNDVIGGRKNDGPVGSVGRDSDIYGNTVSHCWDDGIEVEGDNTNVRVFDNKVSHCYIGIAFASTVYGPLYVFDNLVVDNARSGTDTVPADDKSYGFKMGNSGAECHSDDNAFGMKCGDGFGYIYLYHNTIAADDFSFAPENGASDSGGEVRYLTSKNNIFNGENDCIDAPHASTLSSNDVCNSKNNENERFEVGSLRNPIYGEAAFQPGTYIPSSSSIAKDAGVIIPGFNKDYNGAAPDAGAFES